MSQRGEWERRAFSTVVTVLLSVVAWTSNRLVHQLDALGATVGHHGETLGRLDTRMQHVEKDVGELVGRGRGAGGAP